MNFPALILEGLPLVCESYRPGSCHCLSFLWSVSFPDLLLVLPASGPLSVPFCLPGARFSPSLFLFPSWLPPVLPGPQLIQSFLLSGSVFFPFRAFRALISLESCAFPVTVVLIPHLPLDYGTP